MKVTILGCGPAGGVPSLGNFWGKCNPAEPKNRRLRSSIHIETNGLSLLVDTSPDIREQLLRADVRRLDGVLFTHAHADHLHGIDDIRSFNRAQNEAIPIYLNQATLDEIEDRFAYVLTPLAPGADSYYKPVLYPNVVVPGESFCLNDLSVSVLAQDHGYCETLGFRVNDFAYSTDAVELAPESFDLLAGVKVWVIGALVETPHPTHAHVEKALEWIARVKPERAYLTHLGAGIDYDEVSARLPDGVELCFDGLEILL